MKLKFDSDRIVSVSAMVVGIGSLFAVMYQTHLTREAEHASVLPYLMVALNANEHGVYLIVSNNGVGPAMIEDVRVIDKGHETSGDAYDFYLASHPAALLDVNKIMPGRLIPAGASLEMVGVSGRNPASQAFASDMLHLFEIAEVPRSWYMAAGTAGTPKAVLQITYRNVYGDRWRLRSDRIVPEEM
jgi:hypothetical protein